MIIPFDKLMSIKENKYVLTKALMYAVDKVGNIRDYPDENFSWKVVPNIIKMMVDGDLKYEVGKEEEIDGEIVEEVVGEVVEEVVEEVVDKNAEEVVE